ncbi:hypothetical protein ANCDUO_01833 [Ancylostoma duodenale]|uniref:Fibronectin type III domain protein n=1 Tax=Ancylostoma duodenale TaxID=51022 RepID=A0A0C2DXZ3_9BILA|nr:hypothetical protein ANCDUO_01833 [Ancylostoma duodenale]
MDLNTDQFGNVWLSRSRQGACSDPPTLLERLTPTYMVQNLVVEWKTSNSVKLRWEYNGPAHVGFYLNHTGKKEYFDHTLAMKSMTTPGFKHELDEGSREYLWTNLRPYMQYTFHVGVRSLPPGARQYWPKEVYNGFNNFPLEPSTKYRLMMRSFAKADGRRKDEASTVYCYK